MRSFRRGLVAVILAGTASVALAGDLVVLKGGTVIPLKGPWVRRGNTAYLTRPDGTVLSVAVTEIDRDATATARLAAAARPPAAAPEPAPATPAEAAAARSPGEGPKARVRITDADVSHPMDLSNPAPSDEKEKTKKTVPPGSAKVEIASYDQKKEGDSLIVTGQVRNPSQQLAENVRLNVSVLDENGEVINGGEASLSNGELESGSTAAFTLKLQVGEKIPASLRFAPTWTGPKPPPPQKPSGGAKPSGAQAQPSKP